MLPVLYVLLALVLTVLAVGGYVYTAACLRKKEIDWLDEEQVKKADRQPYYQAILDSDRWLREHRAADVQITSFDGLCLAGKWIPAESPKGTVIMAHGYRSTMLIDCHLGFELFHRLGYNILAPVQRSHGTSEGRVISFGVLESRDMENWIRYLNTQLHQGPVVLFGISMGASTMLYLADRVLPDNVKGIIADCGFTSPAAIIRQVYEKVTHIPPGPVLWAAGLWAKLLGGFGLWQRDSRKILRNSKLPVLLIHGTADTFVPSFMSQQAYDACAEPKKLLLVEGASHGLSYVVDGLAYTSAVIDFLKDYVSQEDTL